MDITSFVLGYKKGKAEGGGALTEPVCHVTFMNGDTVLYEKPVFVGDDCTDIVKKGTIGTPSKASTPQYNYTYTGWSLTNGGEASTSALAAVSGDRTVYAAFKSVVRVYTVTYLDDNGSVLKTESLAYGAVPSYVPTKDGYDFSAWNPEPVAVTGNASYTASWALKAQFETATWKQISEICAAGNAATTFHVGDEKPFTITYSDGTTEENAFVIAGINHTDLQGGTKASLTLIAKYALENKRTFDNTAEGSNFFFCGLKQWLNNELFSALPSDLQGIIKPRKNSLSSFNCWIPALEDLGLTKKNYSSIFFPAPTALPLFTGNESRVRQLGKNGSPTQYYSQNTKSSGSYNYVAYITETGEVYGGSSDGGFTMANNPMGVVLGICI